jgi:hypothetical protein
MISSIASVARRALRAILAAVVRIVDWLLRPVAWLIRHWWRFLRRRGWFGRVATVVATAVVAIAAVLAVTVPWPAYLFQPPFRAVEYPLVNDLQWLRPDGATVDGTHDLSGQGWTREDRLRFYYHAQGSAQVMLARMRYAWFTNLELPFGRDRLAAPGNMARYGFLTDLHQQPDPDWNPGNLPVGFARYYDEKAGAELLDFTCSLCHTGELHYQGTALRIDGGQAMHAVTDMKPGQFQADLMLSMLATYWNPWKFDRFAHNVIDPTLTGGTQAGFDFDAARRELRKEFGRSIRELLANAWIDLKHGNYPVFEGYGRTDATQRIANTVFGRHISPDNYRPATAPVSYPHLWDIAKFNWVQWEGYASQPMARNINESLGVGARLELFDEYGAPLPLHLRYDTSIHPDRLHEIERTLAKLQAPRWPENLFGSIDLPKAREGRVLFDVHCRHCHGPHLTAHDEPPIADHPADAHRDVNIRHNADGSCQLLRDGVDVGRVTAAQCLNLHNPQRIADIDGQPIFELDEQGRVIGVLGDRAVEQWRVAVVPITDVGTDRNAALNFANHRYDASRLGWTPAELRELCIADEIAGTIDPKSISAVVGLNIMSTAITNRYFEKNPPQTNEELLKYMGYGIFDYPRTDPAQLKNYKSRPLHGIWATPPFLHNGSVRTLYQMISPRNERETEFWSGTREYDPVHLGFRSLEVPGAVLFETSVVGNDNVGHEFRDGCQKNGIIGPFLEPEQRLQILEYLKAMDYVADGGFEPALCNAKAEADRAACRADLARRVADLQAKTPRWGTARFRNGQWEGHCSDDAAVYGDRLPSPPPPDDEWETWRLAEGCSLFEMYRQPEGPFRGR